MPDAEKGLPLLCRLRGHGRWRKRAFWPGEWRPTCRRCRDVRPSDIAAKVEASSLGTPEAKALRATVSDEHAARIVARAKELQSEGHDFRDRFCRERAGGGVEWRPGYRCPVCQPPRPLPPEVGDGS